MHLNISVNSIISTIRFDLIAHVEGTKQQNEDSIQPEVYSSSKTQYE